LTILLVEVVCPEGHANGGALEQYAADDPPEAFCEDIGRQMYRWVRDHPKEFPDCFVCHAPWGPTWTFSVGKTKFTTMEEAEQKLAVVGRRIGT
jgi:hypothetical protein